MDKIKFIDGVLFELMDKEKYKKDSRILYYIEKLAKKNKIEKNNIVIYKREEILPTFKNKNVNNIIYAFCNLDGNILIIKANWEPSCILYKISTIKTEY